MDPLTQAALGGTIAAAGFRHRLGGRAVLFGALAGMSPDVDVLVTLVADDWTTLAAHRGSSHSLLVLPWVAPLVGWLGWRVFGRSTPPSGHPSSTITSEVGRQSAPVGAGLSKNRGPLAPWVHLAFWALITHPLLDVCTTYGTQLLAPFSRARFSLDAISIIDPIYTLPLLLAAGLSLFGGWQIERRRWLAWGALVATSAYLLWGMGMTREAERLAWVDLGQERFEATEVRATPVFFFPPLRRVVARDGEGRFRAGGVSLWRPRPIRFVELVNSSDPAVASALETRGGRTFSWFADGWVRAEVSRTTGPTGDHAVVRLFDERYGLLTVPEFTPFVARGEADSRGEVLEVRQEGRAAVDLDPKRELAAGWRLLWGR